MAIHLGTSVGSLIGIGARAVNDFKNLGVISVRDLLYYFPFRYEDYSVVKPIPFLRHGDTVTVTGEIAEIASRRAKNGRMMLTEAVLENETGRLKVVWFNQPYLERTLRAGKRVSLAGKIDSRFGGASLISPIHEPAGQNVHTGRIVPIYGLSGSLKMRRVRQAIDQSKAAIGEIVEWVPLEIRKKEHFLDLPDAVMTLHFPASNQALSEAVTRLKFDELFLHQLMFNEIRKDRKIKKAHRIPINEKLLKRFVKNLPFKLTDAQRKAAWEIVQDLDKPTPMNRLLEGDVGSGKTVVAAMAAADVLDAGKKVVYLAPTEILARQQQKSFQNFLSPDVALLTRSMVKLGDEERKKDEIIENLSGGKISCVVGTHALLQDAVMLPDVALIIIDEQHRFGVKQRHVLLERNTEFVPHLLSMTATPIPRSLALTLYGDLDLSILNQLPANRKPIETSLVVKGKEGAMYANIQKELEKGCQVYVVCPLIDPSDALGAKSVKEVAAMLGKGPLKGATIKTLHGQLKAEEKERTINSFSKGKIDILVSTTVVEVGVDVPNATVMVIVGAERFGLAQLHQLRGRVGRSDKPSYCYLWPEAMQGISEQRLMAVVRSQNGFELAEKDLELRGAGNVFGNAQSGFPDFRFATPADSETMKKARDHAAWLFELDPAYDEHPLVREHLERAFEEVHHE